MMKSEDQERLAKTGVIFNGIDGHPKIN